MSLPYHAKHALRNLSGMAKDNLAANPPRITNEALLEAFRRITETVTEVAVSKRTTVIPHSFTQAAEELCLMLRAGKKWRKEQFG